MDNDPLPDLSPIRLEDRRTFDQFFIACRSRLSDYTFANAFIWRDQDRRWWKIIHDCLCVFANGDKSLTMLYPPLGNGDFVAALRESMEICQAYNHTQDTRIEYISEETIGKFPSDFTRAPMSGDYIYETARMIDLAGGGLASKRQSRNRFLREHQARTEDFQLRHIPACIALLSAWEDAKTPSPEESAKRDKEIVAAVEAMRHAPAIGLKGMVLFADDQLAGFTLGEYLSPDTCSILIEKTDRNFAGSAQYIFSEFCRQYWADTQWCNVGDDWEIPTLAWTKQSYRPAFRLLKWRAALCTFIAAHRRMLLNLNTS